MPLLELRILEIHSFPYFSLTCFDILSWNFAYYFVLLYYRSSSSVVNLHQFLWELCPFLELRKLKMHSFPHFSLTCFDILSWNFAYDFVLLYYRSSLSVVNLRQFLWELCPFWNLEYCKYTVFRTFLLHAFTYWAEILHMTLFYCTTDQVHVSSICVNFCGSYAPFGTSNTANTQFSALFSYMLWHIELKFCIWLCFTVLQIKFECRQYASIFMGVMPLLELRKLKMHSFPHFSLTCFDILSWNFAYDFVLLYYRPSLSVVNLRQFLWELCPFGTSNTGNTQLSVLFSYMLWHIELKFCIHICFTVLQIKFQCRQFASIFVGVMPLLELSILEIHSFPHFSLTCFYILSWNFSYDFVYCTIDQVWMLSLCVHPFSALSSYIHAFTN